MSGDWPHQVRAHQALVAAINDNVKRILLCAPTGAGKTRIMTNLIEEFVARQLPVVLYSNRLVLVEQIGRVLAQVGILHGTRAGGQRTNPSDLVQVASLQTEGSKVLKRKEWDLHDARLVVVDEAHLQTGNTARTLLVRHLEAGAHVVGVTATPVGLSGLYDLLLQAGVNSELRRCGALVPAVHYGPDEPDLAAWKKAGLLAGWLEGHDLSERQGRRVMMTPGIFGRVETWLRRLNPGLLPTILFAPDVAGSRYFAVELSRAGIPAAHVDGADVWVDGALHKTSPAVRAQVLDASKDGRIKVLCNRYVLREGVDAPWLAHAVLACVFGALHSYLQAGGRLLRAYPGLARVTVQDHGGNWWRHGSLNADRLWSLADTPERLAGTRADRLRDRQDREPVRCPECAAILIAGSCACGWQAAGKKSRPVIQSDGTATLLIGDIYRRHPVCRNHSGPLMWERIFWASRRHSERTFRQAAAWFAHENHWQWPDRNWPFMPDGSQPEDWYRAIRDVPMERIRPKEVA